MILYFSGTGNSEYVAKRIAAATGDGVLNLFQKLRSGDHAPLDSKQPWVVVTPTYAWRIPRLVANWIAKTELRGSREIYFVMTCGGNIGNAGQYLKKLCAEKRLQYQGCMEVVMSEIILRCFLRRRGTRRKKQSGRRRARSLRLPRQSVSAGRFRSRR